MAINNVIQFPTKDFDIPNDAAALKEMRDSVRTTYAEEVSEEALEAVMAIFRNYGFYTRADKMHTKDIVAMSEILKSSLLRYSDIIHPMQKVVDEVIQIHEDGEIIDDDEEDIENMDMTIIEEEEI